MSDIARLIGDCVIHFVAFANGDGGGCAVLLSTAERNRRLLLLRAAIGWGMT
jgi:hypothetical protein